MSTLKRITSICCSLIVLFVALPLLSTPSICRAAQVDLSGQVSVSYANEKSVLDRVTRKITSTADITIANTSANPVLAPLHGVITINNPTGAVTMPDALGGPDTGLYGKYYYDLSGNLTSGKLNPGATVVFSVKFVRLSGVSFTYNVTPYGGAQTGNQTPIANAGAGQNLTIPYGQTSVKATLDGSASNDPDGTISSYSWSGTPKPENVVKPTITLGEGTYTFSLTVTDNSGATSSSASVMVTVVKENVNPPRLTITPNPPYTVAAGAASPLNIAVTASSPDNRFVNISATPFITNATFSATPGTAATGAFSLKPDHGQQGSYLVTFTARDSYGLTDTKTIRIDVSKTNRAPSITLQESATVAEGASLSLPVSATDPDGDIVTLSATGLPANAVFIPSGGAILFKPDYDQAGTYTVTIIASDGTLQSSRQTNITVTEGSGGGSGQNNPLTLSVDPVASPTFLATQKITGTVNSSGQPQAGLTSALINGLNPASGEQGKQLSVALTGNSGSYAPHFVAGASTVSFGSGITVTSLTVTGPTEATAVISIDPKASLGSRSVTVTTGNETAVSINAFSVLKGTTSVSGRLVDASGNAIANATVVIQGTTISTTTDANGNFVLGNVQSGEQTLIVTSENHKTVSIDITSQPNTTLELATIESSATVFNPSSQPEISVGSATARGACSLLPRGNKDSVKKMIADTIILAGGDEMGLLDDYGNQQNPQVSQSGLLSLTPQVVDRIADGMMRGENVELGQLLFSFSWGVPWGGIGNPLTLQQWMDSIQEMVNQAWNDPQNGDNTLLLLIFNSGASLLPEAPRLSPATRLNYLQAFLFTNSLVSYMKTR